MHLSLDDPALTARNADLEHERRVAIFDILENNHFALVDGPSIPYRVKLSLAIVALCLPSPTGKARR